MRFDGPMSALMAFTAIRRLHLPSAGRNFLLLPCLRLPLRASILPQFEHPTSFAPPIGPQLATCIIEKRGKAFNGVTDCSTILTSSYANKFQNQQNKEIFFVIRLFAEGDTSGLGTVRKRNAVERRTPYGYSNPFPTSKMTLSFRVFSPRNEGPVARG